jgi:hypothetical protein
MTVRRFFGKTSRGLPVVALILAVIGLTAVPRSADAGWGGGGISPGAAVGLGLGAFALGSVLSRPYYNPYYYSTATTATPQLTIHRPRIIRIIRRQRQLTRRVPAHLNRLTCLRQAAPAVTLPGN